MKTMKGQDLADGDEGVDDGGLADAAQDEHVEQPAMVCRRTGGRPRSKTVPTWRQALAWVVPAIPAPMTATDRGVVLIVASGVLIDERVTG